MAADTFARIVRFAVHRRELRSKNVTGRVEHNRPCTTTNIYYIVYPDRRIGHRLMVRWTKCDRIVLLKPFQFVRNVVQRINRVARHVLLGRSSLHTIDVMMNFSATEQQVTLPLDLQWKMIFNTNEMDTEILFDTDYAHNTVASLEPWSGQVYISI